jgi:hypothetical protein
MLFYEGRCIDRNGAPVEIMQCAGKDRLIGLRLSEMPPEKQADGKLSSAKEEEIFKKTLGAGKSKFEWFCKNMHGEKFWADFSSSAVPLDGKKVICATLKDMTRLRIMEERL